MSASRRTTTRVASTGSTVADTCPADVDRATQFAEEAPLRLPGDSVSEPALDLETLVSQHPRIDRRENVFRSPGDSPGRGGEAGAGDLRHDTALLRDVDARPLLGERLVDRRRIQPDFVSYVDELALADQIAGLGKRTRALELRRAREDALESLAIQQCLLFLNGRG